MKSYKKIGGIYLVWAGIFILVPVVMILYFAFTSGGGVSVDGFSRIFEGATLITLGKSLWIAFLTTVICLLIGYPLAYMITRMKTSYQTTAMMLVLIPMWMNFLLRTYSWITLLSRNGILNNLLRYFGLGTIDILYTDAAVILGMVYNFLPFMILPIYTVLEKMDHQYIEAAADLGANRRQIFTKVIFPLSLPGVISGVSMVFIPSISTFEITTLLGGNKSNLIGNIIEQQFTVTGDWNYGAVLSVVLMIFLVISLLLSRDEEGDMGGVKAQRRLKEAESDE